ncbi:MAG: OmpA family protein [Candidatus Kapabacteria bacterium]|nr:OmpA family protein [Candidatus Kapabacteria bacterium]
MKKTIILISSLLISFYSLQSQEWSVGMTGGLSSVLGIKSGDFNMGYTINPWFYWKSNSIFWGFKFPFMAKWHFTDEWKKSNIENNDPWSNLNTNQTAFMGILGAGVFSKIPFYDIEGKQFMIHAGIEFADRNFKGDNGPDYNLKLPDDIPFGGTGIEIGPDFKFTWISIKNESIFFEILPLFHLTFYPTISYPSYSLEFGFGIDVEKVFKKKFIDEPKIEAPVQKPKEEVKPPVFVKLGTYWVDPKGREKELDTVKVLEYVTTRLKPLLNYIFFDESSNILDKRYISMRANDIAFNISNLHKLNSVDAYYQLLNIVGERMRNNTYSITLVGCNSNVGLEANNKELSKKRTETVRDYLLNTWKISASRIKMKFQNLPDKPSRSDEPDGRSENRRVEIYTNNDEILKPIITTETENEIIHKKIKIRFNSNIGSNCKKWSLLVYQNKIEIFRKAGISNLPDFVDINIENDIWNKLKSREQLVYWLSIEGKDNKSYISNRDTIKFNFKREDKEIGKFSLILFDFDNAEIKDNNKKIAEFIKSRINDKSKITIKGYTDRIGDADYNIKLSQERATNLKAFMKFENSSIEGLGKSVMLYNNDLPEGRFYSRTVVIEAETIK